MGHAIAPLPPVSVKRSHDPEPRAPRPLGRLASDFRFQSLILSEPPSLVRGRSTTLIASLAFHSVLLAAILIVPILYYDTLPAPGEAVRAFFVAPADAAPPPPPPPPPPAGVRAVARAPVAPRPAEPASFVAPVEVPDQVRPDQAIDLGGVEGGVPGGVEGGVPGGVLGGIVGGLPAEAPPPPKVVRIGGNIVAPKLVRTVEPTYPELALAARINALVILEAHIGLDGRVQEVRVLRGAPLFDAAAVEAVKQWRYKPLLLNGTPTEFLLTVTVKFSIASAQ